MYSWSYKGFQRRNIFFNLFCFPVNLNTWPLKIRKQALQMSREFLWLKVQKCVWMGQVFKFIWKTKKIKNISPLETLTLLLCVNRRNGRQKWEIMQERNGAMNVKLIILGYFFSRKMKALLLLLFLTWLHEN